MAIIQRPAKQGGATTFQGKVAQGYTKILASEADADIDTIFAAWNGGADTVNLRDNAVTSAKIAPGAVGARELADGSIGLGEINQSSLAAWVPSGAVGLTPATAGQQVIVPGPPSSAADNANFLMGPRTQKGRVQALPGLDFLGVSLNRRFNGSAWSRDDPTQPAWLIALNGGADTFALNHDDAAGVGTTPLSVRGSDGKTVCTLADGSVTRAMLAQLASVFSIGTPGVSADVSLPVATWTTVVNGGGSPWVLDLTTVPAGQTSTVVFWGWLPFISVLSSASGAYCWGRIMVGATSVTQASVAVTGTNGGGGLTLFGTSAFGPGSYTPILQAFADYRGNTGSVIVQGQGSPRLLWMALR